MDFHPPPVRPLRTEKGRAEPREPVPPPPPPPHRRRRLTMRFTPFLPIATPLFILLVSSPVLCRALLRVGFYDLTCPNAESIVTSAVKDAVQSDPTMAAALLRLHFHDCFIDGCDGSILIDKSDGTEEKKAFGHQGLRGFEVVEKAKAELERHCPGVVSCSDIVALMARDSVALSNGPSYVVPTGRRDGRVSDVKHADDMPDVEDSVEKLKDSFSQRGLSEKDLVVLNAAHTIGTTACFFVYDRLYGDGGPDPTMNETLRRDLQSTCPKGGANDVRFPLDRGSEATFDAQFFGNLRRGFGVLRTDAGMYQIQSSKDIVDSYVDADDALGPTFETDFVVAIIRMGMIGVHTGNDGDIRSRCSSFN